MPHATWNLTQVIRSLACLLVAAGFLFAHGQPLHAAPVGQAMGEQLLLVQFAAGLSVEERDARIAQMGAQMVTWMPQINVAELRLPAQVGNMAVAAAAPSTADAAVTFVEADMVVSATAYEPSDPDRVDASMRYGLERVQAPAAWSIITGTQNIVIAVVDSGVNLDHPEFVGRLVEGYDFVERDHFPDDATGHGTHVTGVIAAGMDNGLGLTGVCPNCVIMPVRVLNAFNLGSWSSLAQGILYATDHGARVINLSLGAAEYSATLAAAVQYAVDKDVVVVAAAGNYASDAPFYPAALDGVIAVSATTMTDVRWARSDMGAYVDLAAPGDLIYSTYHDLDNIFGGYTYMSGTSMAAPFVAGVAGLLLSVEPTLSASLVTEAMILGADDLGGEGWDREFGFGRVNAYRALMAPLESLAQAVSEIVSPLVPTKQHRIFLPSLPAS